MSTGVAFPPKVSTKQLPQEENEISQKRKQLVGQFFKWGQPLLLALFISSLALRVPIVFSAVLMMPPGTAPGVDQQMLIMQLHA
ncbi:hypothetical protein IHE44_0011584 [Lamprotornis superbus]|uniref:Uncharacterized protein n=1 Tax=Lamprotornis superbus TaxID=245042 RepID=A0A835NH25_9PASS|nr:hypothetical protein IHE44_0011584 [Lamprotornis superbus]